MNSFSNLATAIVARPIANIDRPKVQRPRECQFSSRSGHLDRVIGDENVNANGSALADVGSDHSEKIPRLACTLRSFSSALRTPREESPQRRRLYVDYIIHEALRFRGHRLPMVQPPRIKERHAHRVAEHKRLHRLVLTLLLAVADRCSSSLAERRKLLSTMCSGTRLPIASSLFWLRWTAA